MKFTKMHGIGNDYVYVNCFEESIKNPAEVSKFVSDRHFGIGSDGLILISPSAKADFRMNIYNADGSQAEMCGNGIRCRNFSGNQIFKTSGGKWQSSNRRSKYGCTNP